MEEAENTESHSYAVLTLHNTDNKVLNTMSLFTLCCSKPEFDDNIDDEKNKDILDLEKIARYRAWKSFNKLNQPGCAGKCRAKPTLVLDWSDIKFHSGKIKYKDDGSPTTASNTVFKTVFENKSAFDHSQSLKAERQTSATCTSSITKGYTVGCNLSLTLKAPEEIVNAAVGYSKGFNISKVVSNQEERILTWSMEGTINVGKNSKVTAMLQIKEQQSKFKFECEVAVQGTLKGKFYDHKKNVVGEYTDSMRTMLIEELKDDKVRDAWRDFDNAAYIIVKGNCGFKFGIEQETVIE